MLTQVGTYLKETGGLGPQVIHFGNHIVIWYLASGVFKRAKEDDFPGQYIFGGSRF